MIGSLVNNIMSEVTPDVPEIGMGVKLSGDSDTRIEDFESSPTLTSGVQMKFS